MQTHKNPGLRDSKPIPAKEKKSVSPPKYGASTAPQKPPKFGLEGKKWVVEFQRNNSGLVIDECEVNQSVYVYKCDGSTLQVKGKVNNIILDSCKKTAVVFKSVVSSVEFINCQSVQMQVKYVQKIFKIKWYSFNTFRIKINQKILILTYVLWTDTRFNKYILFFVGCQLRGLCVDLAGITFRPCNLLN